MLIGLLTFFAVQFLIIETVISVATQQHWGRERKKKTVNSSKSLRHSLGIFPRKFGKSSFLTILRGYNVNCFVFIAITK